MGKPLGVPRTTTKVRIAIVAVSLLGDRWGRECLSLSLTAAGWLHSPLSAHYIFVFGSYFFSEDVTH